MRLWWPQKVNKYLGYFTKNFHKIAQSSHTGSWSQQASFFFMHFLSWCCIPVNPDSERGLEPAQLFPLRLRPVQGLRRGRVGGHQVGQNHQGMCLSRPYRLSMALSCELIINLQIIRNFRASRVQWDQYYEPDLAVMQLQLKICQFLMRYFGRC